MPLLPETSCLENASQTRAWGLGPVLRSGCPSPLRRALCSHSSEAGGSGPAAGALPGLGTERSAGPLERGSFLRDQPQQSQDGGSSGQPLTSENLPGLGSRPEPLFHGEGRCSVPAPSHSKCVLSAEAADSEPRGPVQRMQHTGAKVQTQA